MSRCRSFFLAGDGGEGHNVGKLSECLAVYVDTNSGRVGRAGRGQKNVLLTVHYLDLPATC